jgi:hypothetical protein
MRSPSARPHPHRCLLVIAILGASLQTSACGGLGCDGGPSSSGTTALTLDPSVTHQTWVGWEVAHEVYHRPGNPIDGQDRHPVPQEILDAMLDDAVDELGITSLDFANAILKLSGDRPGMEPVNDNEDPFVLDSSRIHWTWFDPYVRSILIPMKQRVEARGEPFVLTLSAIAWDAWQWREPESDPGQEYAEFMMACLDRLSNEHGIVPDFVAVYNEPDNSNATESKDEVIRGIKALAQRMAAAGHPARLRFPDVSFLMNANPYFDHLADTEPQLLKSLGVYSFHGYGGFDRETLNGIRSRARTLGIPTVQSEWWFTNDHPADIFVAMTEADVTQYQPYILSSPNNDPATRGLYGLRHSGDPYPLYDFAGFQRLADWYEVYQYSAFIRPGDVRVEIRSPVDEIKPVAFRKPDGRHTVVVLNEADAERNITVAGLSPGDYGITVTSPTRRGEEQASMQVVPERLLRLTLPAKSVSSIYQKSP